MVKMVKMVKMWENMRRAIKKNKMAKNDAVYNKKTLSSDCVPGYRKSNRENEKAIN